MKNFNIINKLSEGENLSHDDVTNAMTCIMQGEATDAQIGAFITGLRIHKETPEIISTAVKVMRNHAIPIKCDDVSTVDIVGTGGDRSHTFNISTTAAFVVAGAGITVAKHGSYGVSSMCGSANVLEALGININYTPKQMEECLSNIGIAFLFAPTLHPAMRHVVGPRRELGIWSLFNILGPLCNPASVNRGLIGVFKSDLLPIVAEASIQLENSHQFIVHGDDGLDEITTTTSSKIVEIKNGEANSKIFHPEELNIALAKKEDLKGGMPNENALITKNILSGIEQGPKLDIVLLNAAFVICSSNKAKTLEESLSLARDSINSGSAKRKLDDLVKFSQQ